MQGQNLTAYFITIGVMIVVVVGVGIAIFTLRRRLFGDDSGPGSDAGGVLETMRAMRDRGEMSEEEYRAAQAALVANAMTAKRDAPVKAIGPQTGPETEGSIRARPGFDLTGAPLPRPPRDARGPREPRDAP